MTAIITAPAPASLPAFRVGEPVVGRFREWTVALNSTAHVAEDRDIRKDRPFLPDLAIIRIAATTEDGPFTTLRVNLIGNGKKKRLSRWYRNDVVNPRHSILSAPAWVRELFVAVTGEPQLVNAYAGPQLGAAVHAELALDVRYPAPETES